MALSNGPARSAPIERVATAFVSALIDHRRDLRAHP